MTKKITAANYRKDKLYPVVARAVADLMKTEDVVEPVGVMMQMQRISKEAYEDWRFGRVPYLERVFVGSLGKANRILRILKFHAESQQLVPSHTVYRRWGKGKKHLTLRFSKSATPNLEKAYSTHYLNKSRVTKKPDLRSEEQPAQPSSVPIGGFRSARVSVLAESATTGAPP